MLELNFPSSTLFNRPVPKTAFYKNLDVNAKMKQRFVDDVASIRWLHKLAPSTLNVADGATVHEITLFVVDLKCKECPDDLFVFIDKFIPRHVVFVLRYQKECKVLLNYKEWQDRASGVFSIVKTFATEWVPQERLTLPLEGQTMDAIYENMAGAVSGYGTARSEDTKRIVELEQMVAKAMREVEALQKKVRAERQLNRQMELNATARELKRNIELWRAEIDNIMK